MIYLVVGLIVFGVFLCVGCWVFGDPVPLELDKKIKKLISYKIPKYKIRKVDYESGNTKYFVFIKESCLFRWERLSRAHGTIEQCNDFILTDISRYRRYVIKSSQDIATEHNYKVKLVTMEDGSKKFLLFQKKWFGWKLVHTDSDQETIYSVLKHSIEDDMDTTIVKMDDQQFDEVHARLTKDYSK